jgi:hypothetical protein
MHIVSHVNETPPRWPGWLLHLSLDRRTSNESIVHQLNITKNVAASTLMFGSRHKSGRGGGATVQWLALGRTRRRSGHWHQGVEANALGRRQPGRGGGACAPWLEEGHTRRTSWHRSRCEGGAHAWWPEEGCTRRTSVYGNG